MKRPLSQIQKILNLWALILIIWSIYRTKFSFPEHVDEFIFKPLIFVLPVIIFIVRFEKKNLWNQIWLTKERIFRGVYLAILIGSLLAVSVFAAHYAKYGAFDFSQSLLAGSGYTILIVLLIAVATSVSEEILSRGFVLKYLYEDSKNPLSASFLASILFLILHIPILFANPELSGTLLLLFLGTDFVLSMVNSLIYLDSRNLIAPIIIHALYNISIVLYA